MFCQNPHCKGFPEFELTEQEKRLLTNFNIDHQSLHFCPQCREMRRLAVRNERTLFKRKCHQTEREIWSTYHSSSPFKVFDKDVWWGDSWDGLNFGKAFDFTRPFFQQYYDLMLDVPRPSLVQAKNQNSDFTNDSNNNNDCYFIFTSDDNVNCHYGSYIQCRDSMDCEDMTQCELCYDSLFCTTCHTALGCESCANCSNIYFSSNLVNCHNCIFCFGLRDKRNCIFNTEVSPDVFMTFILQRQLFRRRNYQKSKEMFNMFLETTPQRYMYLLKTENSTGDRLVDCRDCENSFLSFNCVACSNLGGYCSELKDCMDCWATAYGAEKSFENQTCLRGGMNFVANFSNDCSSCYYIDNCQNCQNCFGCIGLKNKKNCILNKQYGHDEYIQLLPQVIEHLKKNNEFGQFFPLWMSPYAYNTTVASVYYPLKKEEYFDLLSVSEKLFVPPSRYKNGHLWLDVPEGSKDNVNAVSPPDSLFEAKNDESINTIYYDIETKNPFKITGREMALYQMMKIPISNECFKTRYIKRFKRYNPRKLYDRKCQKCAKPFKTTFPPDSPHIVFCSECFQNSLQ